MNPYHEFAWNSVSIHALLAECDPQCKRKGPPPRSFNPRTPCGVRLHTQGEKPGPYSFNPRTPCGVRRCWTYTRRRWMRFQSTHSLRSATRQHRIHLQALWFQSTHSLRSATKPGEQSVFMACVSIHALLAECDLFLPFWIPAFPGFNPRTPCGVRRCWTYTRRRWMQFQSTHSLRSATSVMAFLYH